jgi:hypothetical protein
VVAAAASAVDETCLVTKGERGIDSHVAEWVGWLDELKRQLISAHLDRELFTEFDAAICAKPSESATWLNHYRRLYFIGQGIGLRRIIRGSVSRGHVSLAGLLSLIESHAEELTLDWYRRAVAGGTHMDETWIDVACGHFALDWCDGGDHLARSVVDADRRSLFAVAKSVIAWADTNVAHIVSDTPGSLTFGEIQESIDATGAMWNRYSSLLTRSETLLRPAIGGDWKGPFRSGLFEPIDALEDGFG